MSEAGFSVRRSIADSRSRCERVTIEGAVRRQACSASIHLKGIRKRATIGFYIGYNYAVRRNLYTPDGPLTILQGERQCLQSIMNLWVRW